MSGDGPAGACRADVFAPERTPTAAAQHSNELLAEHSAADGVQEKVDGEARHVQRLRVVAEHVEERQSNIDDARSLHLEDDEVDENRKVEQDVRRRDQNQNDGQLEVLLVDAGTSNALRADRGATVINAVGGDRGMWEATHGGAGVDSKQRDVSATSFPVTCYTRNTWHDERVQQRNGDDRDHTQSNHFDQVHHRKYLYTF